MLQDYLAALEIARRRNSNEPAFCPVWGGMFVAWLDFWKPRSEERTVDLCFVSGQIPLLTERGF